MTEIDDEIGLDMNISTLLLNLNHLLHAQKLDATLMFGPAESLHEEVRTVLSSGDMRSANGFWADKVPDEMPPDINVFWLVVEDWVVGQGYRTGVVWVDMDRIIEWH